MRHSERLERIPPYLFAQLERKIADKRAAGIDVITLGIGDPDIPTFTPIVEAAQRAVANPSTHTYPSNRGREEFREAVASFYGRRFGVELEPDGEVMPAIGAKECIFNLNIAFLDPDDVALAADPGYPVYTGGPLLAGARGGAHAARSRARLHPRPRRRRRPRPAPRRGSCSSTTPTIRRARSSPTASSSASSSSAPPTTS